MKDCIINPKTGRHIKASSQVAKKLIKSKMVDVDYIDCPPKKSVKSKKEKSDNELYILNPKTGRMVLRSGILGKKLAEAEKGKEAELPVIQNVFIPLPSSSTSKSSSSSGSLKLGISFSKRKGRAKSAGNTPSSSSGYSYSSSSSSSSKNSGISFSKRKPKSEGGSPQSAGVTPSSSSSSSGSGGFGTIQRGSRNLMYAKKNPHKGLWNKLLEK